MHGPQLTHKDDIFVFCVVTWCGPKELCSYWWCRVPPCKHSCWNILHSANSISVPNKILTVLLSTGFMRMIGWRIFWHQFYKLFYCISTLDVQVKGAPTKLPRQTYFASIGETVLQHNAWRGEKRQVAQHPCSRNKRQTCSI